MRLKKEMPKILLVIIPCIVIIGISILAIISANKPQPIVEEVVEEIPIVPYSDFHWTYLTGEDRLKYEDDNYTSMFGIDVATFQDDIDWKKVKEDGVEFAFLRLGYRGATEGILHVDDTFEANYKGCIDNNIKVGVYWYSQPANEQEAIEEAQFVLKVLDGRHLDFPIAYDLEETVFADGTPSRLHGFSRYQYTQMAKAFCEEIKKYHQDVMIYTGLYWSEACYNMDELSEYPVWFAQYASLPMFDRPFVMWQYSEEGIVDGIDTATDFDILFIQKSDQN